MIIVSRDRRAGPSVSQSFAGGRLPRLKKAVQIYWPGDFSVQSKSREISMPDTLFRFEFVKDFLLYFDESHKILNNKVCVKKSLKKLE